MFGFRKKTPPTMKIVRGRFDAAQTTKDNARHWSAADFLSADAEASPEVRRILRTRARYEVSNNAYAKGIVQTLANDAIGTGPRLQSLTEDEALNRSLEAAFAQWCREVSFAEKLRTARIARCQDGEAFILLAQNPKLTGPIKLDLQLIEADRVADDILINDANTVDGITFDRFGNPHRYRVLRHHPGDSTWEEQTATWVPAEYIIHAFRVDRPGQHRGIPEITPALPLFAQLRRFTLAVLTAAEAAADFAGILYTDAPANGEADAVEAMDSIQLERNMLLTMPGGWKMAQLDPKQPATTYAEFKREILNEIARCLNIPFNVAAGNSSGYNYASGRLDHQTYYRSIRIDQSFTERVILDRVFAVWVREYALLNGLQVTDIPHIWIWDGTEHVDPAKEAVAQATRLSSLTTTLAAEYAKQGKDWETELQQIARERQLCDTLGIPWNNTQSQPSSKETDDNDE